jgi:hypothetical protein
LLDAGRPLHVQSTLGDLLEAYLLDTSSCLEDALEIDGQVSPGCMCVCVREYARACADFTTKQLTDTVTAATATTATVY